MVAIASVVRIFEPAPTDEFVTKRIAAIAEIALKIRSQRSVNTTLSFADAIANGLSTGTLGDALAQEVVAVLTKESPSFVPEGQEVQVLVCALAAAQSVLAEVKPTRNGRSTTEIFSAALLSGLSFLMPHHHSQIELLRSEILTLASQNLEQTADESRKRMPIPDSNFLVDPSDDANVVANKAKAAIEKATAPLVFNARLDREELELLWWCVSDWSTTFKAKLTSLPVNLGIVVAALEVGLCIRKFPGSAHAHIAMRNVPVSEAQTLAELTLAVASRRSEILAKVEELEGIYTYRSIFPVLSVLLEDSAGKSIIDTSVVLSQIEWVKRILLEIRLSKVRYQDTVSL